MLLDNHMTLTDDLIKLTFSIRNPYVWDIVFHTVSFGTAHFDKLFMVFYLTGYVHYIETEVSTLLLECHFPAEFSSRLFQHKKNILLAYIK